MPVKFKPLRAICSSEASQEISSSLFRFSDFCHSSNHHYEVHPIGGETEESHHEYTCSLCTRQFNINYLTIFVIAVLNKSEKVLGCKSK